jgi:hypothetical protein
VVEGFRVDNHEQIKYGCTSRTGVWNKEVVGKCINISNRWGRQNQWYQWIEEKKIVNFSNQ